MRMSRWREFKTDLQSILWNLFLLVFGCGLCAAGINGVLVPSELYSGGFAGLALVIHYLAPSLPLGHLYFVLNIPVFLLGWIYVGKRFFLYSVVGMLVFSAGLAWVRIPFPVHDTLLSAIFAGLIIGAGSGIILRSYGSAGGLDILSVILMTRFTVRLGTSFLLFNAAILVFAAAFISLEAALYSLIFLYVNSQLLTLLVTGLSKRKAVYIISEQWEELRDDIVHSISRGVTIISGTGGFTGKEHHMLYTVITFRDWPRLKQMVRNRDPNAFVVVADTLEVMGWRVGNQPHW